MYTPCCKEKIEIAEAATDLTVAEVLHSTVVVAAVAEVITSLRCRLLYMKLNNDGITLITSPASICRIYHTHHQLLHLRENQYQVRVCT